MLSYFIVIFNIWIFGIIFCWISLLSRRLFEYKSFVSNEIEQLYHNGTTLQNYDICIKNIFKYSFSITVKYREDTMQSFVWFVFMPELYKKLK